MKLTNDGLFQLAGLQNLRLLNPWPTRGRELAHVEGLMGKVDQTGGRAQQMFRSRPSPSVRFSPDRSRRVNLESASQCLTVPKPAEPQP